MARRALASYSPASMPAMARQSFVWEQRSSLFLPMAVACVEANVIAVIARKAFDASDLSIAALAAAPALSNISSVLWTRLIRGRDRVRAANLMQLALLACVVAIALAPVSAWGEALLVFATLIARTLLTGVITARTDIWRNNYPRAQRARVTGKLLTIAAIVVAATGAALGVVMDALEAADGAANAASGGAAGGVSGGGGSSGGAMLSFRAVYLLSAVMGLVGVWCFSRVRWRQRRAQVRAETDPGAEYPTAGARDMLRLLRDDKAYRAFMAAQFALGLPNLAGIPVFILALDHLLRARDPSRDHYTQTLVLTQVIPLIVPILTIPLWARLLDRLHIVRFRVFHSWTFVLANLLMGGGFLLESLPILYASRVVLGVAYGGGMLAWDLGHHDFARREHASLYMGVHVALTGVRGAIAPFLGTLLYAGALTIPAFSLGGPALRAGASPSGAPDAWLRFPGASMHIPALGANTFFVLMLGSIAGALMFLRLDRRLGHQGEKPKE